MKNCAMPVGTGPICAAARLAGLRRKLPHANIAVANNTSHGTSREKMDDGVFSSSKPPSAPPTTLMPNSALNGSRPAPVTRLRPARPDVTCPGNSATVEVMLAASGDMPDMISAGSVTKEPPPASAFCSPAHRPAAKIRRSISIGVASGGRAGDHDTNAPRAAGAR